MFENVEKKLKILSKILVWFVLGAGIILSIVYAIEMYSLVGFIIGILCTAVAFFLEYIGALFIFAFAELVENCKEISKASEVVKNAYEQAYLVKGTVIKEGVELQVNEDIVNEENK